LEKNCKKYNKISHASNLKWTNKLLNKKENKMDFRKFKKNQTKMKEALTKLAATPSNSYQDDRFWGLKKDTVGNANATIRFLPLKDPAKSPLLLTFRHAFQTEGKWFIEECPVTIGKKCPVCEYSASIWNSDEKKARAHWRTKTYIGNILVVTDEANPENEGKVFLYKFGKSIHDIIMERVAPEDDDEEGLNVFDFDEGANFKLKLVQKGDYNNYEKSKFVITPSAIADGDIKKQEAIFDKIYDLDEFTKEERFKTYDELAAKLYKTSTSVKVKPIQEEIEEAKTVKKVKEIKAEPDEEDDSDADDIDFEALLNSDDDDIPF